MEVFIVIGYAILLVLLAVLYRILDGWLRKYKLSNYDSKYILITGCDTGFGHDFAKQLDNLGCHVFAGCLTEKGAEELSQNCSNRLTIVTIDVTNHDSVVKAFKCVSYKLPKNKGR